MKVREGVTHVFGLDGDALLVLVLEGVSEESDGEVEGGCEHAVSGTVAGSDTEQRHAWGGGLTVIRSERLEACWFP